MIRRLGSLITKRNVSVLLDGCLFAWLCFFSLIMDFDYINIWHVLKFKCLLSNVVNNADIFDKL